MGWLGGYSKRKPITITGGASGAQTDFQLKLAAVYDADMQSDFDDLRFTQADGTTLIDAWLESKVDDDSAVVWAEFPTTPANTVEQTYYMYYGNAGAASDWDGPATFLAFFDGDSTGWTEVDPNGRITFQNNRLEFAGLTRAEVAYVYKAITPMQHDWTANWTVNISAAANTAHVFTMGVSSEVDDLYSHSGDSVGFDHYYGTPNYRMYIWEVDGGSASNANTPGAATPNTRYMSARRVGDMVYCTAYSDAARTSTIENEISKDITGVTAANLDNYFLLSSLHATGSAAMTGYVDDHTCRKYAANPPTYAFGAEESDPGAAAAPTAIFYGPFVGPLGGAI